MKKAGDEVTFPGLYISASPSLLSFRVKNYDESPGIWYNQKDGIGEKTAPFESNGRWGEQMATYVMADIHGCYTEFRKMLEKIGFDGKKDELIIAGDIVDRGKENYEMLEYAASYPEGVTFLMGNHDKDFIYYCIQLRLLYKKHKVPENLDLKTLVSDSRYEYLFNYHVIDHYETVRQLIEDNEHSVSLEDFRRWADVISEFPFFVRREIGGKKYIIVHAGYISEEEYRHAWSTGAINPRFRIEDFYVWAREEGMDYGEEGATVVFGHTPTIAERDFYNHGQVFFEERGNKRFINIDCGCVFRSWNLEANLACIRLDDEKLFYLN